jgi:RsiW-degrading membrane proteinase PrsW (M82 family)
MEKKPVGIWQALALAIFCGLVILGLLAGGVFILVGGFTDWKTTGKVETSLLPAVMMLSALVLASALIGRAGWLALARLRHQPETPSRIQPIPIWAGILSFFGWVAAILLANFLVNRPSLQWFSLPFYLVAVGLPVYGLIRLAVGGLNPGSRMRTWGTLAGGMTISPLLSGLAEGLALLALLIPVGIYMGLQPQRLQDLQAFLEQLKNISSQDELIPLLSPYISNPLVLIGGLFFLSVVTPLVEEIAKSLPVWFSWGRLDSPAQGFALGALSGAGFGLMEGMLVSATPGTGWGATLAVRAASSAMHIITGGIVGWGIAIASLQKRVLPMLGRYLLGMTIHGSWNACVVVLVYAGGLMLVSPTSARIVAGLAAIGGLCFLSLLVLAAPVTLWTFNRSFLKSTPAAVVSDNTGPPADGNMVI